MTISIDAEHQEMPWFAIFRLLRNTIIICG
jgi:hypothetical protein